LSKESAGKGTDIRWNDHRFVEVCPVDRMRAYEAMLSLAAEMVLDEALRVYRKEKIYAEIDKALDNGDEDGFRRLAAELRTI
jgi:uncharacterized protein YpiB (UPF0302 family)